MNIIRKRMFLIIFLFAICVYSFCANWYVSKDGSDSNTGISWVQAFQSIQHAIEVAEVDDKIWVATGIYQEGSSITVPENVFLYGGFAGNESALSERESGNNVSIIDGMNAYRCVLNRGMIDGFSIMNGNFINGAGIYNYGTVLACKVYKNSASSYGGGIYNYDGAISMCEVYANTANSDGGGVYNYNGTLLTCKVYSNSGDSGGGVYSQNGNIYFCDIYDNNAEEQGGGISQHGGTIDTCAIYNNGLCEVGAGIYCTAGEILNCSIVGNYSGEGVYFTNSFGVISNSIIWDSEVTDINNDANVSYCCYQEADGTGGNISDDPFFIRAEGDSSTWDLNLQEGSPCIDSGLNLMNGTGTDIDGIERPLGNGMDMGAYEYTSSLKSIFYCDHSIGMPGEEFVFTDASYGNPDSWQWDFNADGIIDSTAQNPKYIYTESGFYSVSLTVSANGTSHSITKKNYIYISTIFHVKPDGEDSNNGLGWGNAFQSINQAIEIAGNNDHIWVAAGIYQEGDTCTVPEKISIYGGFSGNESQLSQRNLKNNRTIIDGMNAYGCIYNYGTVDGFCITNGKAYYGAGIYNDQGTLVSCDVYGNNGSYGGGTYNNSGTVMSCKVYNNTVNQTGGGIFNLDGSVSFCKVYKNISLHNQAGGIDNYKGILDSNLIFDNFANTYGGGVHCRYGKIVNCTIIGNNAGVGSGVFLSSSDEELSNSIIWNNESDDVYISEGSSISYCCFRESDGANGNISVDPMFVNINGDSNSWDLHLSESSLCVDSGTFAENSLAIDMDGIMRPQGNTMDMGAYEYSDSLRAVFYSDISIGRSGDIITFTDASSGSPDSWQWDFYGNGVIDSTLQHPSYLYSEPGIYTVSLTVMKDGQSNTISKINYIGIYDEKKFYVKPDGSDLNDGLSWENAFQSIDYAVHTAEPFDQIRVAAGTYAEGSTIIIPEKVSLYGGFSGNELLFSERDLEQNRAIIDGMDSYRCVFNHGKMDGFSITNGHSDFGAGIYNDNGTVSSCRVYSNNANLSGGGIYSNYGTISSCMVYKNTSSYDAGGIVNQKGSVSACQIYENHANAGGGISNLLGNVSACDIYSNTASNEGGGIYNDYATLVSCNIYDNAASFGGGVYNYYGAMAACRVYENKAVENGGGIYNYDGTVDTNVLFNNISEYYGGGVFCSSGSLIQCTIAGNNADKSGSGVYLGSSAEISNSIVWANESDDFDGDMNCSYSCFREADGNNGNISADPQFVNLAGDSSTWDFHLKSSSPCIDSGSPRENETVTDMDGIIRPQGNGIDMGAYEASTSLRALFFVEKRNGVPGEEFSFSDASYGNPDSWAWDFNSDGVIDSTDQNPMHSYSEPGFYSVSLTVTENGASDSTVKANYIYITTVLYVKSDGDDENNGLSWDSPFQSISQALEAAVTYDQVWVAAGTYREGNTITVSEKVSLYGGFSGNEQNLAERDTENNDSIIDGENAYGCVSNFGTIAGFHIRNGRADYGAGIHNNGGTISLCKIYGNRGYYYGGGIDNEKGTVSFCNIYENTVVSIGGGIYNEGGSVVFCKVYENIAESHGGGIFNNRGTIDTSVIYDNTADRYASGVYSDSGKILNCTIIGNKAEDSELGVYLSNSVRMINSIIWENNLEHSYNSYGLQHNCYPDADGANGNISADPMLVNTQGDSNTWDFHLKEGSPCIDSGNSIENGSDTDLDGIDRPQGNAMDMGAYEVTSSLRALFFCNKKHGNPGDTFSFTDVSYGNPDSWQWDFNSDGVIDSTEQNPSYTYSEVGNYSVSLTISENAESDTLTKTDDIHVWAVIYVKPDGDDSNNGLFWNSAFQSIHKAVETAYPLDQIWVAAGTYQEGDTVTVPENVSLLGGFAGDEIAASERDVAKNPSIIDGNNIYRCLYNNSGIIDGFSITKGKSDIGAGIYNALGTITSCKVYENSVYDDGGGIVNRQGTVAYCEVYMNTASDEGAGVYNDYGILTSCKVYGNSSADDGGGIFNYYGAVSSSSVYENDSHDGGGIYNYGGNISSCAAYTNTATYAGGGIYNEFGTVSNCEVNENISNNRGGGIYIAEGSVSLCKVFMNFSKYYGGGIYNFDGIIDTSTIFDNLADWNGGGIFCYSGEIRSCSIIGNNGFNEGRGVYLEGNDTKMTNSIIWDNNIDDVYNQDGEISYCCYREADDTDGNISTDPLLVNITGESDTWDFHLKANSPCIDSGISLDIGSDTDMDDVTRPQGNGMDMGAFEYILRTGVQNSKWNIYQ